MEQAAKFRECSYFLVRYVPDLVRDEFLNIGLFLHIPEEEFLDCLFTDDFRLVKRFHPQADTRFLRELQPYFEQQIKEHERDLAGFLREMRETYSNLIQVSELRTCLMTDPQAEMQQLFARYVGARRSRPPALDTRMRIKQQLTEAFRQHSVLDLKSFERRVPAEQWTAKGDPFCFDFGYRSVHAAGKSNGRVKLVHALSLLRDNELVKALRWTFDKVLEKEPAGLTVVHEHLATPPEALIRSSLTILENEFIQLLPVSRAEEYARSIHQELSM